MASPKEVHAAQHPGLGKSGILSMDDHFLRGQEAGFY